MRAISSWVAARSCSTVYGQVHVVELRRALEPVEVVEVAEDRRAALGLVAADALEYAGAVVQAVREHVDLGVLPGDELPVLPDELRFDHAASFPSL